MNVDNVTLQIENEYGDYYEQAYGAGGKPYAMWAASMALAQNTGVPWIMCQESDAPDPVVSLLHPMPGCFINRLTVNMNCLINLTIVVNSSTDTSAIFLC